MTREPESSAEDRAIDEQIRRLAADSPDIECPTGIADSVLAKVKRRRLAWRARYAAAAALLLATIGLSSFQLRESDRPGVHLAGGTGDVVDFEDLRFLGLDPEYLATPPPVISLNLISEDQFAMFHCLENLEEDFQ